MPLDPHLTTALSDRYRIERELGAGGMATVYLAEDLKHHRKVAIKVLRPELAAVIGAERFLREIETTANLRHPHILPLFDSGSVGQGGGGAEGPAPFLYYVMPLVEGESLHDRLVREKQLPIEDALRIAREVADALSYAHAHGVVHRDIKPDNIMLESGHAVVADFGIAKAVAAAGDAPLTQTGIAVGTPQYMSPEQAAGERTLDGRSDLYSLACVLYEMLAGQPPFTGPTVESVIRQHMMETARPVSQLRPAVPPAIADVVSRALAKTPADRFSPAAHFAAALMPPASAATPVGPRSSRTIVLAGGGVLVLAALAFVLLGRRSSQSSAVTVGRTIQVTRDPGLEIDPALSPDGANVAYASGPTTATQIYVRQVSGGRPVTITSDTGDNFRWPRWSPDGTQIAYESNTGILVAPALGGAARQVVRLDSAEALLSGIWGAPITGFDWSPDGSRIAWTLGYNAEQIRVTTVATGATITLNAPKPSFAPAWSPDGRTIAVGVGNATFHFGTGYFANTAPAGIWLVHLDGSGPTQVAADSSTNTAPQWSADGHDLFWISDRDGGRDIYRQHLRGKGTPEGSPLRLTTGTDAGGLSLNRRSGRMAYSRLSTWSAIWSIPIPAHGPVSIRGATRITTGNETIEDMDLSPDGRWLAFGSDRDGTQSLYVMPSAGGEARLVTGEPAGDYSADWSPNGKQLLFNSRRDGTRNIYMVDVDGSNRKQWTSGPGEKLDADWAPDGQRILYEVLNGGAGAESHGLAILRLASGATPQLIPIPVGDFAHWSPDGTSFVYHAPDGLRVRRIDSGAETLVVSNSTIGAEAFYAAWGPGGHLIYYLAQSPHQWSIRSVPAGGGASTLLVEFDDPNRQHTKYGFCTDGKRFFVTIGAPESDIFVASLNRP